MQKTNTELVKKRLVIGLQAVKSFFFPPLRDTEMPQLQVTVTIIAFYALALAGLLVIPVNMIREYRAGLYLIVIAEGFFLFCILLGVLHLIITHTLVLARNFLGLGVIIFIGSMVLNLGGNLGFGFFYIVAGYPLFYYIFGFKRGIALPFLVLLALVIRLQFGAIREVSLFYHPETRLSYLLVMLVAGILGTFSILYQHLVLGSLYKAAYTDELTGIANRRQLEILVETKRLQALQNGLSFSLIGIKVLHFARINSFQGSRFADEIIKSKTQELASVVGLPSTFSRYTGTVFVAITEKTGFLELEEEGSILLSSLQKPVLKDGKSILLDGIVSITRFPQDGLSVEDLMSNLMAGFTRLRDIPGALTFYDESQHLAEVERYILMDELRNAFSHNELALVYQPKILLETGKICGAEILLRWNSKARGTISPTIFIPLAENAGLIRDITHWVISNAVDELLRLQQRWPYLIHALNLSPKDLEEPGFADFLNKLPNVDKISTAHIEFEITEGVIMNDNPVIQKNIDFIRGTGCRLAIDDFGTGFSNLSYLHKIKAQNLKIDRSFIMPLNESNPQSPVIDAIISMATSLKMDITAEGIETPFQEKYLKDRACTFGQGYLYAKPLPFDSYVAMLEEGQS
ncbi:hypothetical protein MASR2M78_03170 [Treponema sp.]